MFPELGHFALILALCIAAVQGTIPFIGASRGHAPWMAVARPAAYGQFLFLSISLLLLIYAFVTNDFSVRYAASNSNSHLPLIYRISAVWGGHEGSLLLWAWMMGGWAAAAALFSRRLPPEMVARVLGVLGLVSVGFLLFLLLTSSPFERLFPVPPDGRDLNPMLQDPGLVLHPPMLYMGYVGFSVAFAFAIASLLGGRLDAAWARWSRPWTTVAWVFMTLGISLGSWWAYYELGWGGWWFWDPVENASFMPWLVGTALMHSLAVAEKRSAFKGWTVLLAIFAFSLSLLGTFLVRSGVLTSVHAFADDPSRGVFILGLLGVVVGVSLVIYAWRAPQIRSAGQFSLLSRETALLANNILLVVATGTILIGTVYPLVVDALQLGKISVGPPYFNTVFVPLMAPLMLLLGFGPLLRWKQDAAGRLAYALRFALAVSLAVGILLPWMLFDSLAPLALLGVFLGIWIVAGAVIDLLHRVRNKSSLWAGLKAQTPSFYGMTLAHLGVAVTVIGITLTTHFSIERDVRIAPGDQIELGGYQFHFDSVRDREGPNYDATRATFTVSRPDGWSRQMETEKRLYWVQGMPMTEVGLDVTLFRDIYVALGEPLDNGAWAVRIYHKPFIRWIWLGSLFMAAGGLLAAGDRRYRLRVDRGGGATTAPQGSRE